MRDGSEQRRDATNEPLCADADGDGIAELVRAQQRIVRRYGRYAARAMDRMQSGDLSPDTWFDAYGRLMRETTDDILRALRAWRWI